MEDIQHSMELYKIFMFHSNKACLRKRHQKCKEYYKDKRLYLNQALHH